MKTAEAYVAGSGGCSDQRGEGFLPIRLGESLIALWAQLVRPTRTRTETPCAAGPWNAAVIADSDDAAVGERNHHVLAAAIKSEYIEPISTTTVEDAAWNCLESKGTRQEPRRRCRLLAGRRGPLERS